MPYPGTPEFNQMLSEVQVTMWEAVALMLVLGTIVLFIIILSSIAWLCLSEMRGVKRGRPITHEAQRTFLPSITDDTARGTRLSFIATKNISESFLAKPQRGGM